MIKDYIETKVKVYRQGPVIVNGAIIEKKAKDIVAISVDLGTKWCEVGGLIGENGIFIDVSERSTNLKKGVDKDLMTVIEFPEFKAWEIFSADTGKYTLKVCLIKK